MEGREAGTRPVLASEELLIGVNPILEQLRRDPRSIRMVVVARGARGGTERVVEAARRAGVMVAREDPRRVRDLGGGLAHQGVVALRSVGEALEFEDLVARRAPCLVVADQVTDPRNLGALVRCAEATGVGGVVVPRDRSAAVTPVVAKAAAGATAFVPVAQVVNLARALRELQRAGYWIVGLDGDAPQSVFEFSFPDLCVLVVGAEGKGLRPLTRSSCDYLVSIPMLGQVASLNVSVAAAVALYERVRQTGVKRVSSD